jgi:sulfite exporter TauE/SafE
VWSVQAIDSTAAAFMAGLVTSVHCLGMCGPMVCAWSIGNGTSPLARHRNAALYHGARIISYTTLGAVAGALGTLPLRWLDAHGARVLPWLLVLVFLAVALGLGKWLPKPLILTRPMAKLRLALVRVPVTARATMLGAATPLLPCGPLYLMLTLAMMNGSLARGAQFAAAFGLGTLPLLWLAQTQVHLLGPKYGSRASLWIQRALALSAALIMVWRLRGTFTGEPEALCCHSH